MYEVMTSRGTRTGNIEICLSAKSGQLRTVGGIKVRLKAHHGKYTGAERICTPPFGDGMLLTL